MDVQRINFLISRLFKLYDTSEIDMYVVFCYSRSKNIDITYKIPNIRAKNNNLQKFLVSKHLKLQLK